jgi:3-methylfumaryl-CoA hydratase
MMTSINVDELKAWIGRSEEKRDIVTPRLLSTFRATITPHLAPSAESDCPPGLHWCLVGYDAPMNEIGEDGHPKGGAFLPPVPLPNRMWAGGSTQSFFPLEVGDEVVRRSTIADITVKEGRSGTLCFVVVEQDYITPRGTAMRDKIDVVFRDATASNAGAKPAAAAPAPTPADKPKPEKTWTVDPTRPLLFRYSALTFNAHRIHYDYPYATQVEGYPELLVHGPLQATMLFNLAATVLGKTPPHFEYRGLSPVSAVGPFTVNCLKNEDGSLAVWTEDSTGKTGMKATAKTAA